jgi:hypothetical protein
MRSRINLFAFTVALAGAGVAQLGHPVLARATMAPSILDAQYCCSTSFVRCCGTNWCAITPRGCVSG